MRTQSKFKVFSIQIKSTIERIVFDEIKLQQDKNRIN